ncbi:MAG: VC0807 family protein [Cellvibrionaceae bacterium]
MNSSNTPNTIEENTPLPNNKEPQETDKNNPLAEMLINIVIPVVVLSFLSKEQYLGTKLALIVAFAFPVLYGIKDLLVAKKVNFFSILGVVTVGLTGGMGLLEIDPKYIAIKEAAVPAALGIFTLFSLKTRYPLVKTFIYNKQFVRVDRIDAALAENNSTAAFEKSLQISSILLALSFFVSATTNYILAKVVLVSPPGTEAFNVELGKMLALSYPVNVVPAMIVQIIAGVYTYKSVKKHTHLTFDEILGVEEQ